MVPLDSEGGIVSPMQMVRIAALVLVCAALGFLLGRLIRGRTAAVSSTRPRVAISAAYLRDARNTALSPHTRLRCAWESIYLCCCEVACARGVNIDAVAHPSEQLVSDSLTATTASLEDRRIAQSLTQWSLLMTPALPEVPMNSACLSAERIYAAATATLP